MTARALIPLLLVAAGCGGGSSPTNPTPSPGGGSQPTFTISSAGVSPKELTVAPGTRVLFINNDTRRHDMGSDPHPDHDDCPPLNQVGVLLPGERRETGNLNTVRTCGFHDHDNPTNQSLQGRVIIR